MTVDILLHGEAGRAHGHALVSPEDAPLVAAHKWWVQVNKCGPYAYTWGKREDGKLERPRVKLYMHRLVAQTPRHLEADHRNRKTLDNQRANLRNVPKQINGARAHFYYADDTDYEAFVEEAAAKELAGAAA